MRKSCRAVVSHYLEVLYRILKVRDVFFGAEEGFDGLPSNKTLQGQGGDFGGFVVVLSRLQGMLTTQGGVDKADSVMRRLEEYLWRVR